MPRLLNDDPSTAVYLHETIEEIMNFRKHYAFYQQCVYTGVQIARGDDWRGEEKKELKVLRERLDKIELVDRNQEQWMPDRRKITGDMTGGEDGY